MHIGEKEAKWLMILLFVSKLLFLGVRQYVAGGATAAWLQAAWCALLAIAVFAALSGLYRRFEGRGLFDLASYAFGDAGLKILGSALFLLLAVDAALLLRMYADTIASITLSTTPAVYVMLFLLAAIVTCALAGVESVAKYSYVAGICIVALLLLLFAMDVPNLRPENLLPLLGNGPEHILLGFGGADIYADMLFLFFLTPYLSKDGAYRRAGYKAVGFGAGVIVLTTLVYTMNVPYPASGQFTLPVLELSSAIPVAVIFQRAESIFLVLWIFSGFLSLGALFCFGLFACKETFHLQNHRAVIGALTVIIALLAMTAGNYSKYQGFYQRFHQGFTIAAFAIPAIVFIGARIRARGKKGGDADETTV